MGTTFAWHVHHDTLIEPLLEPLEARIEYIKKFKPFAEWKLRLRLLKVVRGELPVRLVKARAACDKARAAYYKARAAYYKARAAYYKAGVTYGEALMACRVEIEALHAIECPGCPWDGHTIFREG